MGKKQAGIDWAALEPLFRAGVRSVRDLGREFGVSDKGITKHAEKNGWVRTNSSRLFPPVRNAGAANQTDGTPRLTPKQERFCVEYMKGGNASAAYRLCYEASDCTEGTVNKRANELVNKSHIAGRIKALRDAAATAASITQGQVLAECARLGLSDAGALFDENGDLKPIKDLPPEIRACIASVEIEDRVEGSGDNARTYRVKKVKLWDKNSALEKLMKHLGMYERDNKQKAGIFDGMPREEVEAIVERLRAAVSRPLAGGATPSPVSRFTH